MEFNVVGAVGAGFDRMKCNGKFGFDETEVVEFAGDGGGEFFGGFDAFVVKGLAVLREVVLRSGNLAVYFFEFGF